MKYCIKCGKLFESSLTVHRGVACFACKACGFTMPITWHEMMEAGISMYGEILINELDEAEYNNDAYRKGRMK